MQHELIPIRKLRMSEIPQFYASNRRWTPDVVADWEASFAIGIALVGSAAIVTSAALLYHALTMYAFSPLWALVPLVAPVLLYLTYHLLRQLERYERSRSFYQLLTKECLQATLQEQNPEYGEHLCEQISNSLMHLDRSGGFKTVPASKATAYLAPVLHKIEATGADWILMRFTSITAADGGYELDASTAINFEPARKKASNDKGE